MSGRWGQNLRVSIFGESHGAGIGIVIDGLPSGLAVDWDEVARELKRRAPGAKRDVYHEERGGCA